MASAQRWESGWPRPGGLNLRKIITLTLLFGEKSCHGQDSLWKRLMQSLMEALAKLKEDEWQDDGEVEIPSDEEFIG